MLPSLSSSLPAPSSSSSSRRSYPSPSRSTSPNVPHPQAAWKPSSLSLPYSSHASSSRNPVQPPLPSPPSSLDSTSYYSNSTSLRPPSSRKERAPASLKFRTPQPRERSWVSQSGSLVGGGRPGGVDPALSASSTREDQLARSGRKKEKKKRPVSRFSFHLVRGELEASFLPFPPPRARSASCLLEERNADRNILPLATSGLPAEGHHLAIRNLQTSQRRQYVSTPSPSPSLPSLRGSSLIVFRSARSLAFFLSDPEALASVDEKGFSHLLREVAKLRPGKSLLRSDELDERPSFQEERILNVLSFFQIGILVTLLRHLLLPLLLLPRTTPNP